MQIKHIQTIASPSSGAGSAPTRAGALVGATQDTGNDAYDKPSWLTDQNIQTTNNLDLPQAPESL